MFHGGNMSANSKSNQIDDQEVDVLYQKLGERWFAFSIVNDEVFMSPISDEEINNMRNAPAPAREANAL
jgi:hypothetical protein